MKSRTFQNKLAIITAHAGATCMEDCVRSWGDQQRVAVMDGRGGLIPAYQFGYEFCKDYNLQAYFHDDLIIDDPTWLVRVMEEFSDPEVGLVGFGGALGHGAPELYKAPYQLQQLARFDFMSNLKNAEVHGKRFEGSCDVAVLDGFAMIVRREILDQYQGWPVVKLVFHCYDYWLSCFTRRLGYRIRMVGVACNHIGGQTSVTQKMDDGLNHAPSHEYIAKEFRDVLPYRVPEAK